MKFEVMGHDINGVLALVEFLQANQEILPDPVNIKLKNGLSITVYHELFAVPTKTLADVTKGMVKRRTKSGKV